MSEKIYKVSFNLQPADFRLLESFALAKGVSTADIIRMALGYYKFLQDAQARGDTILVEDAQKNLSKVVLKA